MSPVHPRPFQRLGPAKSLSGLAAAATVAVPAMVATRAVSEPRSRAIPPFFHRMVSRSLGVHVEVQGEPASGGVLYVSNHLSWLDIPVLGSKLAGSFVAKSDVAAMGVVGWMADMQRTIYVDRARRTETGAQANAIAARLRAGENVFLFPEGTTNDGVRMLPFKSSLFAVVEGQGVEHCRVQPLSLAYTRINGMPATRNRRIDLAWIGELDLGPHALALMRMGKLEARIRCHPPVRRADFPDRKALARHCERQVAAGLLDLTRGQA